MMPVSKPALLRQVFALAVAYPAQVLSYQKMLGQLRDAGNTTTVASYIRLLSQAFLISALERWSESRIKQRGSIPKLLVMDNALISAIARRYKKAEPIIISPGKDLQEKGIKYIPIEKFFNEPGKSIGL